MPGFTMKRINGRILCFNTLKILARLSGARHSGILTTKQFQDIEEHLQEKNIQIFKSKKEKQKYIKASVKRTVRYCEPALSIAHEAGIDPQLYEDLIRLVLQKNIQLDKWRRDPRNCENEVCQKCHEKLTRNE